MIKGPFTWRHVDVCPHECALFRFTSKTNWIRMDRNHLRGGFDAHANCNIKCMDGVHMTWGITSTLHMTDQSTTRACDNGWSVCHRCNSPVSPSFAPLTSSSTDTWWVLTRDTRLAYCWPREGFLSCDFLSTPTFYIGNSVRMRIETTSGGDFDPYEFNSFWMWIEIMHIHVDTHRHASMWKGL